MVFGVTRNAAHRGFRDQTGEQGDECSIRPGEAGTGDLTAEHGELVAEDEDLGVLGHGVHPVYPDDLEHPPDQPVEQGQPHGGEIGRPRLGWSSLASRCWTLHG